MGTSDQVLKENINRALVKLDSPSAQNNQCPAHESLAEGVKVLLQIQKAILDGKLTDQNSIRVGNLQITGGFAVLSVVLGYTLLKLHGVI